MASLLTLYSSRPTDIITIVTMVRKIVNPNDIYLV